MTISLVCYELNSVRSKCRGKQTQMSCQTRSPKISSVKIHVRRAQEKSRFDFQQIFLQLPFVATHLLAAGWSCRGRGCCGRWRTAVAAPARGPDDTMSLSFSLYGRLKWRKEGHSVGQIFGQFFFGYFFRQKVFSAKIFGIFPSDFFRFFFVGIVFVRPSVVEIP